MNLPRLTILRIVGRKVAVLVALFATGAVAFASLGEGYNPENPRKKSLLNSTPVTKTRHFSLRSGYTYRGSQVFSDKQKVQLRLNTTVSVERGNTVYIVPLKKKSGLDRVKLQIGNQHLGRN
jgi:hypothetical protein